MTMLIKLLRVLNSSRVGCQWWCDKRYAGEQEGYAIRINPKYDIVPSVVHELLHLINPDEDNHDVIEAGEKRIMKRMTREQAVVILKTFVKKATL